VNAEELSCRELVELVTEYLEGTLPPGERDRFEAHLANCPHCGRYLDQMGQTIRALGRLSEEVVAPEAREALLERFRDWKKG
jgi:anti-sigma factor (TIGR02949 family)